MNKSGSEAKGIVFLDRDGVLNKERGGYTFKPEDFVLEPGVVEALRALKEAGYLLIVITNQGGIAKGIYTERDMMACHAKLQAETGFLIDDLFYSPYHPDYSQSLGRKPGTLLFERALASYAYPPHICWMVGDQERDLLPAKALGIRTIFIGKHHLPSADFITDCLASASKIILHPRNSPGS